MHEQQHTNSSVWLQRQEFTYMPMDHALKVSVRDT